MKNYYDLLEISVDSSKEEIKDAYRKLAQKYHPDKNGGAVANADTFVNINEAKQILFNENKKAEYDVQLSDYLLATHNQKNKKQSPFTINYSIERKFSNKGLWLGLFALVIIIVAVTLLNQPGPNRALTALAVTNSPKNKNTQARKKITPSTQSPIVILPKNEALAQPSEPLKAIEITGQNTNEVVEMRPVSKEAIVPTFSILSAGKMEQILVDINTEKLRHNNSTNCITVMKSIDSNVENAFELAKYLSANGYTIAGRQASKSISNDVVIDAASGCIKVTIGKL